MDEFNTTEIELAIANFFNPRQNLIIPNVSWGWNVHECDLLVVSKAGYAWEIEIKTTVADLKRDQQKRHKHASTKIARLYFAIPKALIEHIQHIPKHAGIIVLSRIKPKYSDEYIRCVIERMPVRQVAQKISDEDRYALARLGALRIWGLKQKLLDRSRQIAELVTK